MPFKITKHQPSKEDEPEWIMSWYINERRGTIYGRNYLLTTSDLTDLRDALNKLEL